MVGQKAPAIVAFSGMGTLALAAFMAWYGFPKITDMKLKEAISMDKGTESYEMWENIPFPLKFNIYIFNIMNPDEVQNGAKPIVKEIGPYVYDLYIRKENVEINEEQDTVKYILKKTYYFNSKETGCRSEDDEVTILNAALVGTALTVYSMFPSALGMVSQAIPFIFPGTTSIFMKVKVKDLLFNGVLLDCSSDETEFICQSIGGSAPETIRKHENDRDFLFSMFHHLNGTAGGPYVTGMGLKNTSRGEIHEYRDEPDLGEMWHTAECNQINGTDSTIYAPFGLHGKPKKRLYCFSADLCRSLYLELENETTTFGIPCYHYTVPERLLRAAQDFKCFCPRVKDKETMKEVVKCTPAGTFDLTPCMTSPTLFSWPHFYLGDESLLDMVSGLSPDKDKHENFVQVEPMTGTPVKGAKRAQFNLHVQKLDGFTLLSNVSDVIIPLIWIEEYAELPPEFQKKLTDAYKALGMADYVKYFLMILGLILLIVAGMLLAKRDNLFCFSDSKVNNIINVSERPRLGTSVDKLVVSNSDNDFNSDLSYPNLFPQMTNKNMNSWKGEEFIN